MRPWVQGLETIMTKFGIALLLAFTVACGTTGCANDHFWHHDHDDHHDGDHHDGDHHDGPGFSGQH